ncbi:PepSY domain-containing protein [Methanoplanus limicola]|uniref:PepSY domain-containing protein n=1 Tax=Methanoplanus limicola DSM 2279 TaxID=937775 RepID=H1YZC4_9EURY|nr:PepSY domain-containing protein [Methanoplanus limicola]EHQ35148.1 hypothetical protein Metlim_1029 [Methanoplanus limicola DSM 2279]
MEIKSEVTVLLALAVVLLILIFVPSGYSGEIVTADDRGTEYSAGNSEESGVLASLAGIAGEDAAKTAVINFLANSSVILKYEGTGESYYGDYYKFSTDGGERYYVNSETLEITLAHFPVNWSETLDVRIEPEDAEDIARDYIAEKTSASNAEKLEITESKLLDHGAYKEYSITFNEIKDRVYLPNSALISLNPSTGEIITYMAISGETEVSLVPEISEDEALEIAKDQFDGIVVTESDARLIVDCPAGTEQKLLWRVDIKGKPKNYISVGGIVLIDAVTGEVILKDPYL